VSVQSADLVLRGGLLSLLLLIAGLLLREHPRATLARLGAAFAIGTGAYVVCSATALVDQTAEWEGVLVALAAGNSVLLWLLASALFEEEFQLQWWHGLVWCTMGALGIVNRFHLVQTAPLGEVLRGGQLLASLVFAALALRHTVSSWRADLLEARRRLRLFVVVAAALHLGISTLVRSVFSVVGSPRWSIANALILLCITVVIGWELLRTDLDAYLPAVEDVRPPDTGEDSYRSPSVLAEIERVMRRERVYLEGNLTIGALAAKIGLLEYKLRRIINQGLGYRNFNSFLNHYRIEHAKGLLTAPRDTGTSVLTVAMECGFQSLGPFNRAFKAHTGMTPSEFRRARPADSKIG
jgi:AraC-like DNA-binding protein